MSLLFITWTDRQDQFYITSTAYVGGPSVVNNFILMAIGGTSALSNRSHATGFGSYIDNTVWGVKPEISIGPTTNPELFLSVVYFKF